MLHFRKSITSALCLLAMSANFSAFAVLSGDELSDGEAAPSRMSASVVSSTRTPVESTQPNNGATPMDLDSFVNHFISVFGALEMDRAILETHLAPIPPNERKGFISLAQGPCNPGMYEVDKDLVDGFSTYTPTTIICTLAKVAPADLEQFVDIVDLRFAEKEVRLANELEGFVGWPEILIEGNEAEDIVMQCYREYHQKTGRKRF